MNLQLWASWIILAFVIRRQLDMFKPCNRLQCIAIAWIDDSVICSSPDISRACRDVLFSTKAIKPWSVKNLQFVKVKRSTRVQTESGITLPSLTLSAREARFNLLMKSRYEK
jgi:hypothetical protein